ncbi:anaphase-promoting complex subunit 1-like isoform X2 [Durio zibethinus]|uniref:Anaphase-promoting complex subunit 1 n=1 Tax=Durio zibethinus TaxID=66656 RepID=A0A6P5Z0A2_DURZI|nr:anaphase-promoting complex subunit 1-like isoform X2 [Durio zibethinus]
MRTYFSFHFSLTQLKLLIVSSTQLTPQKMSIGVRQLTVLGEFKPFGLIAEALDGKPPDNSTDNYDYFLFDPEIARQRDDNFCNDASVAALSDRRDHELFIRGNRIIWSIGSRVFKRFTLPSPVIMACWCRMGDIFEALLCVLQIGSLTIYNTSGEVVSIPLPCSIISIWSLPFGLLLQQVAEGNSVTHGPFSYSSPSLGSRDIIHNRTEIRHSTQHNFSFLTAYDHLIEGESSSISSHLILKDLLEEPQSICIEERGKLNIMRDFDERTIWTGDQIPLMASYNKVKMQHSVWVAEVINSSLEVENASLSATVPAGVLPKCFCFRRIWQGKGAHTAASKVFLATDDDAAHVICLLFLEQKKLLSLRLQTVEINNEILYDVKPDMSWSIPAIAAAPVIVTRPRVKVGLLPYTDIIVLAPENILLLYSGKQCLCRYLLPPCLGKGRPSHNLGFLEAASISHDLKIVGLADAVEAHINVKVNNWQMFRCALRRSPSSSLANDSISALAEGLSPSFYNHFLVFLWGDGDSGYLSEGNSTVDSEWNSFCDTIMQMCKKSSVVSQEIPKSSWEFLLNSKFHKNYFKINSMIELASITALDKPGLDFTRSNIDGTKSSEKSIYSDLLMESLDSLHAVYESLKMDNLRGRDLELLAILLCNIAKFLGEECYLDHYVRDFPVLCKTVRMGAKSLSRKTPFSLFRWLENCLLHGCNPDNANNLPLVICKDGSSVVGWTRKIISFYSLLCGAKLIGKKLSSGVSCNIASGSFCSNEELTVLAMVGEKFGLKELDSLPSGVSLPLRHALDKCRESPPADWPAAAYVLLGREDLALSCLAHLCKFKELETQTNMNLVSMSTPYMLHLHPVTIPSTVSDTIGLESTRLEDTDSIDGSMADGMENIFSCCNQLRYGRDLRLNEVRRLLCSARPVAIQTSVNPSASDQELQQAQLWQLAQRTTALPLGRGAFTLATIYTLLTEAFTVPKLVLAGRLPAQQNATVNLDPNIRNIQELKSWPEFHNAVAAGLRLAPLQGKVSRTWIVYNKPEEPNVVHAGLLLALGLHGFLRVLTITDIYQYFSQEHESTTVGLMLGLAASYRGTMQPAISKCLYVHIPAQHPSSFPELELPTLLQTAALMSVGLLFEGSAHPQTMQTLLGEIGRRSGGDNVLEREGYSVSAGFSLGLVALGRGEDAFGFMDTLVDRLFQYICGKEIRNERSLLLAASMDEHSRGTGQMMDGTTVNVDVAAPGAIIALALMFLKSESEVIVSRLTIPQTRFDFQYVRPDFIMLRVIARNLIMWGRIHPSKDWIQSQIPEIVKNGVKDLRDDTVDIDEMDLETFVQAYVNIVAGACISLGLRFAGTKDASAQELLYEYAVYFLNEIKPVSTTSWNTFPKGLSQYVDRGTLEICLHLIVLSLSVVMAGSGHLQTFRLLRFLRNQSSVDGHANYGIQMVVSLAIGFLFLGGGMKTFSTSNSSIAALLITLYPRLPTGPNDNRCHLQLKTVKVCGPRYWPQVIELVPDDEPWWSFGDRNDPFNSGVLHVKRKVGACSYVDDPIGCQSLLSRAMHKMFGLTSLRAGNPSNNSNSGPGAVTVEQLVSTFSSDPSLIAFAQLCCDLSWNGRSHVDFQEFCLQVLFECISKDRPSLLQIYLSLYTTIGSLAEQVSSSNIVVSDSLSLSNLKLALSYNEAVLRGRLTTARGSIVQSIFLGSLRKRVEELLNCSEALKTDLCNYLNFGSWPNDGVKNSALLSWYLQWFSVPATPTIKATMDKIKLKNISLSAVPLLCLLLPGTHINAIEEINQFLLSS